MQSKTIYFVDSLTLQSYYFVRKEIYDYSQGRLDYRVAHAVASGPLEIEGLLQDGLVPILTGGENQQRDVVPTGAAILAKI